LDSTEFKNSASRLTFAIGQNISGDAIVGNIAKMPHLLVAGTTGSGKSVCLNSLILSILYKASPDEVKFIMIDPKMVEFKIYNGIPHLLVPVVTEPKKAAGALQWAVVEMEKRYRYLSDENVRDLASYNEVMKTREDGKTLPQLVVVIDELADLMMTASKEVEESIIRIAQMGRAAGVHLVIATQSPRADIITGLMKSNIPARIALQVSSALESRIIMEATGADKLLGNGDMLFRKDSGSKPVRIQGTWVSDEEREDVINFIKRSGDAEYAADVIAQIEKAAEDKNSKSAKAEEPADENDYDDLLPQAVDVVFNLGQASVSQLQRRLKLGYSRAARIVDQMEELGIIGPFEGSKPRPLLITRQQWQERQFIHGTAPIETLPEEETVEDSDEAPF
ncbi:MAG: DNA translocase FtsK, partial [Oscillospiraceae bacterium]|nr:DNA translocase FtsK [Oscillospiraceae bacterium]